MEDDRSGKSGKRVGGGGRNREAVPRSPAVFMLAVYGPPPEGKSTFSTSTHWWGEGVAELKKLDTDIDQ